MASVPASAPDAAQDPVVVKTEPGVATAADRILAICAEIPDGISDKILKVRIKTLNQMLISLL